jgi:hypothetical protein
MIKPTINTGMTYDGHFYANVLDWKVEHFSDLSACWLTAVNSLLEMTIEFVSFGNYKLWVQNEDESEFYIDDFSSIEEAKEVAGNILEQLAIDKIQDLSLLGT